MYHVELYLRVRLACHRDGLSQREAARRFGIDRKTVAKILKHSVPPGYQRGQAPKRPKLDPYTGIIDQILEDDKSESKKQRHTCKRIFEWLRDEHGYSGGITIVTDYVRARKRLGKEVFVPLAHDPGHAQVDFGEAWAIIAGVKRKVHYFALDLPHSDACFVKAYPAETTEAFCDGHVAAFGFFGGIPLSILYDNTTLAVAKIKKDGKRVRTETFTKLQSHYLFQDKFARPAKGNEKGKVEGLIGYVRRNYLVPIPRFDSFDALNAWLEEQCLKRQGDQLRGRGETIEARLMRDLDTLMALSEAPELLLHRHLKKLRLPTFLSDYEKLAKQCAAENKDHVQYLLRLSELELIERERRMIERRIRAARFGAVKSLDSFDFKAMASLNKPLVMELARCQYIEARENVIALGPSGTGKTHIALGLGLAACQKGLKVRFITAAALVHELMEAGDERRLLRLQKQLASQHLLIIDELGFVPLSKTGAELLFETISQCYPRHVSEVREGEARARSDLVPALWRKTAQGRARKMREGQGGWQTIRRQRPGTVPHVCT